LRQRTAAARHRLIEQRLLPSGCSWKDIADRTAATPATANLAQVCQVVGRSGWNGLDQIA